jgi:hypothetical protein
MIERTEVKVQNLLRQYHSLDVSERREFYSGLFLYEGSIKEDRKVKLIKNRWTVAELLLAEFQSPRWIVPGFIPLGLTSLAGRPKLGKSWLALQIAHAVGSGGRFFDVKVERGNVLYLALEDSPRRLQDRIVKQTIAPTVNITFEIMWNTLSNGGLDDLKDEIGKGAYTLVVIDTISRALGQKDQKDEAAMTYAMGNLQRVAMDAEIGILIIDHHRKNNSFDSDPVDDILGSTAKAAVVDGVLGLYREKGKHEATLKIVGRDIEEEEYGLKFDGLTGCWQNLGNATDVRSESVKGEVLKGVQELIDMGELPTTTRISERTGIDRGNVSHAFSDLVNEGHLIRGDKQGREVPYYPAEVQQQ